MFAYTPPSDTNSSCLSLIKEERRKNTINRRKSPKAAVRVNTSSRRTSGGFFSSVLAIATRCFSPPLSLSPRSPTTDCVLRNHSYDLTERLLSDLERTQKMTEIDFNKSPYASLKNRLRGPITLDSRNGLSCQRRIRRCRNLTTFPTRNVMHEHQKCGRLSLYHLTNVQSHSQENQQSKPAIESNNEVNNSYSNISKSGKNGKQEFTEQSHISAKFLDSE
ncbi:hypothetical protein pdam_00012674 [Pocillopora damicornis]|uniref:Uncharacterized protein n=1 Tax=Pocillopora damicornis TaxID=46731 RepID=A0A3M6U159_POCDA|nr:hypothetical protein pdam_00012674 [Pocillopora damicornis]